MYLYLCVYWQCSGDLRGNCMLMSFNHSPTELFAVVLLYIPYLFYTILICNMPPPILSGWPLSKDGGSARGNCVILVADYCSSYLIIFYQTLKFCDYALPCGSIQLTLCSTVYCQIAITRGIDSGSIWLMVIGEALK